MVMGRDACFRDLINKFFSPSSGQEQLEILKRTVALCESVFKNIGPPYFYTDHGVGHSDSVLYYALRIARCVDDHAFRLNDVEAMALACACYLHDLGMAHVPESDAVRKGWPEEKILAVRSWHVDAIEEVLPTYYGDLKKLYDFKPILQTVLPQLCRAHGTESHKDACKKLSKMPYKDFRGDLVGKILLLADELDLSQERSMVDRHSQFETFPTIAKAHHFKHYYVVDVQVSLPLIRIIFAFPEEMSQEDRNNFKEWTYQKIQKGIELVSENLSGDWRGLFDIMVLPTEDAQHIFKRECPRDVCNQVEHLVLRYLSSGGVPFPRKQKAGTRGDKITCQPALRTNSVLTEHLVEKRERAVGIQSLVAKYRPHQFYPKQMKQGEPGSLYPVLNRLMDDFFRECNTPRAVEFFNKMYIKIPQNEIIGEELAESLGKYSQMVRKRASGHMAQGPFVIVGQTGAGKSTLLLHLENEGKLCTRFLEDGEGVIVARVNCLNFENFTTVIREMLGGLVKECKKKDWVWSALQRSGWENALRPASVAMLSVNEVVNVLRGVLDLLHTGTSGDATETVPVCFVLDNIDRMPGFELKERVVTFATREGKSNGFPFFVITLRSGTKYMIDSKVDDIAALGTHHVTAPRHAEVLQSRLDVAFSNNVTGKAESWCQRVRVESSLGKFKLEFLDLRKSLETAMRTLTGGYPAFVSSMAGNNIRNALTLCRAIIKFVVDEKRLLMLSKGGISGGHYLIQQAMLENNPYYSESNSKIRNLYACDINGFYFARLYMLGILERLQSPTNDFVGFGEWKKLVLNHHFDEEHFMDSAWSLMKGNLALIEVEGTDDTLPNDRFKNVEHLLKLNVGVKISTAGEYYLSWLMYDVSYIGCVLQDTMMEYKLAKELDKPQKSVQETFNQVEKFLDFLEIKENNERIALGIGQELPPFVPKLRERIEQQKRVLIS